MIGTGGSPVLQVDILGGVDGLRHGFTTRRCEAGSLPGPDLFVRLGLPGYRPVLLRQVHGDRVVRIGDGVTAEVPEPADGAVTSLARTALTIRTADCVAILAADPVRHVIGAAHAGWRGISLGIPAKVVRAMTEACGCRAADLLVGVGPAIGPCCYSVGKEVRDTFAARGRDTDSEDFRDGPDGRLRLDLHSAVHRQLRAAGIAADSIETIGLCTSCRPDLLFSYRRDGPGPDRMHAFIAWTD
jgi:YfiH family protein